MEHSMRLEKNAAERVSVAIGKPLSLGLGDVPDGECFDPWEDILNFCYGNYCSDFDECAIGALEDLRDGTCENQDIGSRMIRENLCIINLCDYGSSPRVCFPTTDFKPLVAPLIEKWKAYSALKWG